MLTLTELVRYLVGIGKEQLCIVHAVSCKNQFFARFNFDFSSCKPGDRVRVIGIYRCLPSKQMGYTAGTFRTVMIANNIQLVTKDLNMDFTHDEARLIRQFQKDKVCIFYGILFVFVPLLIFRIFVELVYLLNS